MRARFSRHSPFAAAACLVLASSTLGGARAMCGPVPCAPVTIGLDTSQANTSGGYFLGEAPGQTFLARDTLIHSLTVWRVASQYYSLYGMHLYITETDSTGTPLVNRVVQDGPVVFNPYGDGIHPTPFQWVFDPPVALPRTGRYAFFLEIYPCQIYYFDVLGREEGGEDLYPDGHYWSTTRSGLCLPEAPVSSYPTGDMIFQIEFCDSSTPVRPMTWGRLKMMYR